MSFFERGELHKTIGLLWKPNQNKGAGRKDIVCLSSSERTRAQGRDSRQIWANIFFNEKDKKDNESFRYQTKYYELKIPNTFSHFPQKTSFQFPRNRLKVTFTSWLERLCLMVTVNLLLIRTQHMPTSAINTITFLFIHIWFFFHLVCATRDSCTRLCRNEHHSGSLEGN